MSLSAPKSVFMATWGYDDRRLRYLYLSAVEPIPLYGCSLWAPFLATKKGVKCVRSFQRVFAIARTKSFKTTSTDALLVLANVDPIDFTVMKTAYLRLSTNVLLLPTPGGNSPSPLPPRWPPWVCLPKPIQLNQGCSLLPASAQVARIFVTTARSAGIPRFAIISANHKNVVDLDSGALPVFTSDNMTNLFAMHRALVLTARALQSHEHVEIISPSTKLLSFLILGKLVSSLQLNCLDSMVPIRHNTSFYVAQDLSSSYGLCLTRVICESSDIRHPVIELHQPKEVASAVASMLIKSLHEREWASGLNATTTRSFFPTVQSASMLLSAQLNCQLSQILSGHSALNSHQYRFKFRPSPA
ncbi:hypothetical protein OUZ56_011384 [Daphnia magna]|uniref:Uncharacterized protein n=1 Tax=Daphnia magna TaxID=35525 RepID=A0ABQ9Z0D9_9CRUS|nr:hypothetical protein OUZ56_011384 [Daphnia magna]